MPQSFSMKFFEELTLPLLHAKTEVSLRFYGKKNVQIWVILFPEFPYVVVKLYRFLLEFLFQKQKKKIRVGKSDIF